MYIYMYNTYTVTNKNGIHVPISFYMADGMISYLYYFPATEQYLGSIIVFFGRSTHCHYDYIYIKRETTLKSEHD